jgi:hypothetical protein
MRVLGDGTVLSDGGGGLLLACTSYYNCVPVAHHDSEEVLLILSITSSDRIPRLKKMGKEVLSATLMFSSHRQRVPGTG